jgi:NAD(P)-dependent dehydrogenase (short-subunit alcohol dehydrogenase family)
VLNDEVADLAIALMLAVARRIPQADRYVREGKWRQGPAPLARKVSGARLGIVGLGRIGNAIAKRAEAFDMSIAYTSRTPKATRRIATFPSPAALAAEVDFLVVITPGGAATRKLIDAEVLTALGPQGYLINVARGSVVDETALIAALQNGTIAGAGLDVFEAEPNVPGCALRARQRGADAAHRQRDLADPARDGRPVVRQPAGALRRPAAAFAGAAMSGAERPLRRSRFGPAWRKRAQREGCLHERPPVRPRGPHRADHRRRLRPRLRDGAGAGRGRRARRPERPHRGQARRRRDRLRCARPAAETAVFDVADSAAVRQGVDDLLARCAPIDILVNNAGIQHRTPIDEFTDADWQRVMATNLDAPFFMARALIPQMKARRRGKIVNICSLASTLARPTTVPYQVSKGGIAMLTRGLAVELAPHGIQVNGIAPGFFRTEMNTALTNNPEFTHGSRSGRRRHAGPSRRSWPGARSSRVRRGELRDRADPLRGRRLHRLDVASRRLPVRGAGSSAGAAACAARQAR